jgi:hypothetical protein
VFGFHGKACLKSKKTPSIPTLKAPLPSPKTKETSIKVSYLAQGLETSKIHTNLIDQVLPENSHE